MFNGRRNDGGGFIPPRAGVNEVQIIIIQPPFSKMEGEESRNHNVIWKHIPEGR